MKFKTPDVLLYPERFLSLCVFWNEIPASLRWEYIFFPLAIKLCYMNTDKVLAWLQYHN